MQNQTQQHHHYGWVPDHPDRRDHPYVPLVELIKKLPQQVDLRPHFPAAYDQGHLHSCTANAIAGAVQYNMMKEKIIHRFRPSRLFIYYNARALEGKVDKDSGSKTRDAIKSVARQGDCPEYLWPYRITKFSEKPPKKYYRLAVKHKALEYQRLKQNLNHFQACLASGHPFIAGLKVFKSFEKHQIRHTGRGRLPRPGERPVAWHAVLVVGYNDNDRRFILRNSWGKNWGLKGYFTLPYEYLLDSDLSKDFWTIRLVS
ncbi:peptidase [Candidatus Bathyarchaeota archaeon]|nr:MAG: peptidase [Candidatus Bathyarchaeota archaeon]